MLINNKEIYKNIIGEKRGINVEIEERMGRGKKRKRKIIILN